MIDSVERVARFVDSVLNGRRPQRFTVDRLDGEALRTAAALAAGTPGADEPSPRFVEDLHRRLAQTIERERQPATSRRRLFGRFGVPAVAALLGAGAAMGIRSAAERLQPDVTADDELVPQGATAGWMPVASLASLTPGQPLRFTAGAISGFLTLGPGGSSDDLRAVSAVCTHMGCLLNPNLPTGRLDCPCHGASFTLEGSPLSPLYTEPLPRLRVRVAGDVVEVYAA